MKQEMVISVDSRGDNFNNDIICNTRLVIGIIDEVVSNSFKRQHCFLILFQ